MDLRIENAATADQFCRSLAALQAPLPWRIGADPGDLIDDNGEQAAIVAIGRDHETAAALAMAILIAVNTCGGYRAKSEA